MKHEIRVRVKVIEPPSGVTMMVQRGPGELLAAASVDAGDLVFEFALDVDLTAGTPNFLGKFAQGPKSARFIYVNSGSYAGHFHACWDRRAKLSLMSVTTEQVKELVSTCGRVLETSFPGTAKDGGPTCASVKGLVWTVVKQ